MEGGQSIMLDNAKRLDQLNTVYRAFWEKPMTMKKVDQQTGIMRENICRYCKTLRDSNKIFEVSRRRCTVTGYPNVIEWTTNPDLAPPDNQLRLF